MREYHQIDKTAWGEGPWKYEPDYVVWIDFESFYPCVARRNMVGAWCGYVALAPHHPLYRVPTTDHSYEYIDCHGGISFAGFGQDDSLQFSPPLRFWWVGFDAMQETDLLPELPSDRPSGEPSKRLGSNKKARKKATSILAYRDLEFIRNEVGLLAMQLSNLDHKILFGGYDSIQL